VWCRTDLQFKDGRVLPTTNHHPRCKYVDASLINVWSVRVPGETSGGCIVDTEEQARQMANEDPDAPLEIVPIQMHREVIDALPEFPGF
jgi:hypothetical protein